MTGKKFNHRRYINIGSTIMWFRQDLRLGDNPALAEAVKQGKILPVYILDDDNAGQWKMGSASRVWLHHILNDLNDNLDGNLQVFHGEAKTILKQLVDEHRVDGIYWNRCYEPWRINRDKDIKGYFEDMDLDVQSFNGSLLWEPWTIKNQSGDNYKVFTPFYKKGCLNSDEPREPLDKPKNMDCSVSQQPTSKIDDLQLLPKKDWHISMVDGWDISEQGAHDRLNDFLDEGLKGYKEGRNNPWQNNVSRLSPYLHWGLISPNFVWHTARPYGGVHHIEKDMEHFCSELGWREFSNSLLYNYPNLPTENLQDKFDDFPWRDDADDLKAWQHGQTGCPMVDAGMRELYQTGYMHNRMRMTCGSFLVKNLMLHWHHGEEWFWDCLADADLANNAAGWQWIAGCGADAAPYFRIFNPVTQGQKFDTEGDYVRHYVPELKDLPNKYLFSPWDAPDDVLEKASVKLGETYPKMPVDLKASRERALDAFSSLKKADAA
jgi:deoxyribodipyrimidine photo-lyase